jgi:hypothetical protein
VSVHQDFSRRVIPLFLSVGRSRAVAYSLMSTGSKPSTIRRRRAICAT